MKLSLGRLGSFNFYIIFVASILSLHETCRSITTVKLKQTPVFITFIN